MNAAHTPPLRCISALNLSGPVAGLAFLTRGFTFLGAVLRGTQVSPSRKEKVTIGKQDPFQLAMLPSPSKSSRPSESPGPGLHRPWAPPGIPREEGRLPKRGPKLVH